MPSILELLRQSLPIFCVGCKHKDIYVMSPLGVKVTNPGQIPIEKGNLVLRAFLVNKIDDRSDHVWEEVVEFWILTRED